MNIAEEQLAGAIMMVVFLVYMWLRDRDRA